MANVEQDWMKAGAKEAMGNLNASVGIVSNGADYLYKKTESTRWFMKEKFMQMLRHQKRKFRYGRSSLFR